MFLCPTKSLFWYFRIHGLGNSQEAFLVPEPPLTAQLPSMAREWENQPSMTVTATLSSPPQSLGRFASIVQASYMLSRVLSHVSDISMDAEFQRQQVEQMDKTLQAFIRYSDHGTGTNYSLLCYQRAILLWQVHLTLDMASYCLP